MGWAEDQAKAITDAEERVRKDREWQLHVNTVVKAEAPAIFERLADQVADYVARFNAARGASDVRCERSPGRVEVIKEQPYPAKCVRLTFIEYPTAISVYKRSVGISRDAIDSHGSIQFSMDKEGGIHLGGGDAMKIAEGLLYDVFDSFRPR